MSDSRTCAGNHQVVEYLSKLHKILSTKQLLKMPRGTKRTYKQRMRKRRRTEDSVMPSRRRGYLRVAGRSAGALVAVPERKYFDSLLSNSNIPAPTDWTATERDPVTLNTLFLPTSGAGISNRIGRKVAVLKIKLRGFIQFTNQTGLTAVPSPPSVRLILYQDKQSNGTQAQGEELMAAPATASPVLCMSSHQSLANFGRFRVLKDKTYTLQNPLAANNAAGTTVSADFGEIPFKFNVNFRKPVIVHFNAVDGGTAADIVDNQFHMLACATVNNVCTLSYVCRTVFADN